MTDTWRNRILQELTDVADGVTRVSSLQQAQQEQDERARNEELEAGLAPATPWMSGRLEVPDFADSLQQRLQADGAMPYVDANAGALYSINLLEDPLQEKNLIAGEVTLSTSWSPVGSFWEARVVPIAGAIPTVTVKRTYQRTVMEGQIYRTNVMVFDTLYAAAGSAFVEYRPTTQVLEPVHIDWPWGVAAARCYIDTVIRPATNLLDPFPDDYADDDEDQPPEPANYVRMGIVDGDVWLDDASVEGDETELQKMSDDRMESQVYVSTELTDAKHWWVLQMRTEVTAAGGAAIAVAEPQFNYSYQESPMPFEPAIGSFDRTQDDIVPGYPGDNEPPGIVQNMVVTPLYREHDDGTTLPVLAVSWDLLLAGDILGYEIQWDVTTQEDDGTPIPPDWTSFQSIKVGPETLVTSLDPVIGGSTYAVRIRAYDTERMWGDWNAYQLATALPDLEAPPPPDDVQVIGGFQLIGVTWSAVVVPDLSFYQVRYRVVGEEWGSPVDAKSTRLIIDGLQDTTEYEAQVRAVDRSGNVQVSFDPDADPPQVIANYQTNLEAGWSDVATGSTTLIGAGSVAFSSLVAGFIETGVLSADQIHGGELRLGGSDGSKTDGTIRIYDKEDRPIGAWGPFGWLIADPENHANAMWGTPQGEMKFTAQYQWDGTETSTTDQDTGIVTVTAGIEQGIDATTWTTAIGPYGINAEAITFGTLFGGNNRLLNAGFELQDFDVATLEQDIKTDAAGFADGRLTGLDINLNVAGTEIRMSTH